MFLLAYYSKEGIGVYQGDPLSPLLFGFISHFLLEKINPLAIHVQMFADDLILIMKGSMIEINYQLQKIYKIIKDFGMNPNDDKTKKTLIPKEILYLGIWLDKKTHLKFNFEKVNNNFEKVLHIFKERNFSNGLKIQFFKAVLHSQLLYGLEIFDFTESDFKKIDIWINKKITESLLINPHSPRLIYKTEAKIDLARITIYKRKFKLIQKLKILGFDKLINLLPFREKETENINWKARNLKELESELEVYRINQLKNSPSWKVQNYLKIILIQGNINKQQKYLKWKGSTSILKLRNYTNYLNRYSYFMNKNKSQFCQLCKINKDLDIIEDLDHFLWNCPAYENNRKIWISELEKNNFSLILNNNNIYNIINKQDSISLLALVDNKTMFESIVRFLNSSLGIRANKRNSKLLP
ncbi:type-1 retrotransposable element r1dm-like protein [Anaeramoeba flamelloides]|uniref:Type-1 retrotransposable element r1dm-like protein n=1 Tax=Anaeramoeba flamelloides TaxID=1746091 RepID=A0ABQ8XPY0_9EUKA|nr:type-1 retrotransposable element r1dm-like protein [Anaeramoeba flamelloides]